MQATFVPLCQFPKLTFVSFAKRDRECELRVCESERERERGGEKIRQQIVVVVSAAG